MDVDAWHLEVVGGEGDDVEEQGEGDIKEKLVISMMNKDLVSRNEKVQVQVKPFEPLVQL